MTNVGSPYCYWDLSTRINYMNLPLCEDVFLVKKMKLLGVNIMLDNKPKVTKKRHITIYVCFTLYTYTNLNA